MRLFRLPKPIDHLPPREQRRLWKRTGNHYKRWGPIILFPLIILMLFAYAMQLAQYDANTPVVHSVWLWVSNGLMLLMLPAQLLLHVLVKRDKTKDLQRLMLEEHIRPAVCFRCGYDLRASTDDTCSECGEAIALPETT